MTSVGSEAVLRAKIREAARSRVLDLSWCNLVEVPESVRELTELTRLELKNNSLRGLPEWIGELRRLRVLLVDKNELECLPESIGDLAELDTLQLGDNKLEALPDAIGRLSNLRSLKVYNNRLRTIPSAIADLYKLRVLNLGGNQLQVLPDSLGQLTSLVDLHLYSNPLASPSPEVVGQGARAVLSFLRERAVTGSVNLWRSKVLIIGEAAVGKTSLFRQLTGGDYDPDEPQTHGVHIDHLQLEHPERPEVAMDLSVWDFGGQLEYRATQRFYLTDRSLFVLVWNARRRWQDGHLEAWLETVAARAPRAPVLIVATHVDDTSPAALPDDLQQRHPQVVASLRVDAATGTGIPEVREAIRTHAAHLPLMGVSWPKTWVAAARAVWDMEGLAVTATAVWEAMASAHVTNPDDQRTIAAALHDLGDIVHFADDPELSRKVVLRPAWLDARITEVLDSKHVTEARGVLSRSERSRLWGDLEDLDLADRLLRMMERFDLAYRVGDADSSEDVALVVERLGLAQPAEAADQWEEAGAGPGIREIGIVFKLRSRQAGIPTWFIARMHRYTTGLHWHHGVLLHDRDPEAPAWALLTDDGRAQPTVTLRVRGRFPVRFLSVLWEAFKNIVEQRYADLIEAVLVPCSCDPAGPCPHLYSLKLLLLEADDASPDADHKVRCEHSGRRVDVRTMLDGLPGAGLARELGSLREAISDNALSTSRTLDAVRVLSTSRSLAGVHCPSLFQISRSGRAALLRRRIQISLWCEWPYAGDPDTGLPGGPHPLPDDGGTYVLKELPHGIRQYLPYLSLFAAALGVAVPMVTPSLFGAGKELTENVLQGIETSDKVLDALGHGPAGAGSGLAQQLRASDGEARWLADTPADFRALRGALRALDPQERWGGLSPVARPEDQNTVIYVCRRHYLALQYPFQDASDAGSHSS